MIAPPHPHQDARLAALRDLEILDTPREADFDEIVELAARVCDVPIALVSFVDVDRQWFKAEYGLGMTETDLNSSVCAHAILQPGLTVIPDALKDPRLADNPLCGDAFGLRFYAGAPLRLEDGHPVGTLCLLDTKPRTLTDDQRFALQVLANQVTTQLKFRKAAADALRARQAADEKVAALEQAARTHDILVREIDHRVKNSLGIVASLLSMQAKTATDPDVAGQLSAARERVMAIAALHEQMHLAANYDAVDLQNFVDRLAGPTRQGLPPSVALDIAVDPIVLPTPMASSFGIILNELITNALKHAFPGNRPGTVGVRCRADAGTLHVEVHDDGVGFDATAIEGRLSLGMRVVQRLSQQLGGAVEIADNSPGTRVRFAWPLPDVGNTATEPDVPEPAPS